MSVWTILAIRMQFVTMFPFWGGCQVPGFLSFLKHPSTCLPSPLPPSTVLFSSHQFSPTLGLFFKLHRQYYQHKYETHPSQFPHGRQPPATPDEVTKSTQSLRLAVEHAISLHVSPKEVRDVVNLAIEEGMKKHISLAVKRAISANASPEQVRVVVEDAIKEEDIKKKRRRCTKLIIGHRVPVANLVIVQTHLFYGCRTRSD